jgi:hypothetical protein
MDFCEHCEGQRFDRSRILRALRQTKKDIRDQGNDLDFEKALTIAIKVVRAIDIPHLEPYEEEVVH